MLIFVVLILVPMYKQINLPAELVEELGLWKIAFERAYLKPKTYADMIRGMLASLEDSDPAVFEEHEKILKQKSENNG